MPESLIQIMLNLSSHYFSVIPYSIFAFNIGRPMWFFPKESSPDLLILWTMSPLLSQEFPILNILCLGFFLLNPCQLLKLLLQILSGALRNNFWFLFGSQSALTPERHLEPYLKLKMTTSSPQYHSQWKSVWKTALLYSTEAVMKDYKASWCWDYGF